MRCSWNWKSAMWNEDLLPHDSDRDAAKRVNHGRHCNVSYRTSTLIVTCSPIYSICTVYFRLQHCCAHASQRRHKRGFECSRLEYR